MSITPVSICNRGLQLVGAKQIVSIGDNSVGAKAVASCYDNIRDAELRAHVWSFAIRRASLAADAIAPVFGKSNSFTLPADWLRMTDTDPELQTMDLDFQIEGKKILTNQSAPLNIRYVARVDESLFDPIFAEALAARVGATVCEQLTQSNTKIATCTSWYKDQIAEARRINAIEKPGQSAPADEWLTVRNTGGQGSGWPYLGS